MKLKSFLNIRLDALLCALLAMFCAVTANAQNTYPDRQIRFIVPYNAGGGTDVLARAVAASVSKTLKQSVVVENKPGASGMIGADYVARANPDGYTFVLTASDTHTLNPHVYPKITYDAKKDFLPVVQIGYLPYALIINNNVKANNLKEFIALAKKEPGKLTFASWGVGSSSQAAMESFKVKEKLDILHVPFTGAAPAVAAVLGGQVDSVFAPLSLAVPNAQAGKVKILGLGAPKRFVTSQDILTLKEQGVDVVTAPWIGILAPAKTPQVAIDTVYQAVAAAAKDPQVQETLTKAGLEIDVLDPKQFAQFMDKDYEMWGAVVKAANIKAD